MKRLLFALALCLLASSALAAPRYKITNLGTLPGYGESYATCLNDKGQVAGYVAAPQHKNPVDQEQSGTRAFLWSRRQLHMLPTLSSPYTKPAGTYDAVASGINNRGQVVGTLSDFIDGAWLGTYNRAVLWQRGKLQELPQIPGSTSSTAIAINKAGQIAGTSYDLSTNDSGPDHIYLYGMGQSHDLGFGSATGLNSIGQVCGYVLLDKDGNPSSGQGEAPTVTQAQAILCKGVNGQRLTLDAGYALNLNESGSVIGMREILIDGARTPSLRTSVADALVASLTTREVPLMLGKTQVMAHSPLKSDAYQHAKAILWRTGHGRSRTVPLPFHWVPQSINDKGQMVGDHWLWHDGYSDDLNTLLPALSGWRVIQAAAINNKGQIAGYGKFQGQTRAFLLTPRKQ